MNDAALASLEFEGEGRTMLWKLNFTSLKSQKGYRVEIQNGEVVSTEEIGSARGGSVLPSNIISAEEAVRKARAIPGFKDALVISVELQYGPDGHTWYWGVTTDKGVITIKAN